MSGQLAADDTLTQRVNDACGWQLASNEEAVDAQFPADGQWTWDSAVTLVAQSASKLFDGQPLTRPSDVLVYGLPADF